jgi:hypothetical protein
MEVRKGALMTKRYHAILSFYQTVDTNCFVFLTLAFSSKLMYRGTAFVKEKNFLKYIKEGDTHNFRSN